MAVSAGNSNEGIVDRLWADLGAGRSTNVAKSVVEARTANISLPSSLQSACIPHLLQSGDADTAFRVYCSLLSLRPEDRCSGLTVWALSKLMEYSCSKGYIDVALTVFEDALTTGSGLDSDPAGFQLCKSILDTLGLRDRVSDGIHVALRMLEQHITVHPATLLPLMLSSVRSGDLHKCKHTLSTLRELVPSVDPLLWAPAIINETLKVIALLVLSQ